MKMIEKLILPEPIVEYVDRFYKSMEDVNGYEEYDIPQNRIPIFKDVSWNFFGKYMIDKFISGEELLFESEKEFYDMIDLILAESLLVEMASNGLVRYVGQSEDGENLYEATDKGIDAYHNTIKNGVCNIYNPHTFSLN